MATKERREDIEDLFARYTRSDHPGPKQKEMKKLTVVLKMMGVQKVRPGKNVEVASTKGQTAELPIDQLTQDGVSFAYRFAFRHE